MAGNLIIMQFFGYKPVSQSIALVIKGKKGFRGLVRIDYDYPITAGRDARWRRRSLSA